MLPRFQNAAAAMSEMRLQQEQVANNLANASTTGYKKDRVFTEALNERLTKDGSPISDRRLEQANDLSGGSLKETGNPLDVALGDEGFFVTQPRGGGAERYTRAGHFVVGSQGTLRTPEGREVMGEGGPIQLPVEQGGDISISKSGRITAGQQRVGTLRVATFENPEQLERTSGASFAAGDAQPQAAENPVVLQGKVETSNVDPVTELTNMIEIQRQFEAQQKTIQTTDGVLGRATQSLGGM
ncbi:flagellar basal-body rod protein FlgF [Salinibacter ruber]|uniref:flagellar basal-body rod protein FlgF n=1 Tax=Salinibacter ruber TaxID=146919 RepID=UPI0021697449|nr:flagellar basal-body rod protein FlgF [Salinibacter ruber]MCS4199085.1 flagellar basal-body rod protein FlgF/flagellar basal-body rod protein FlgG [Salinibacter ruber]